MKYFSRLVLLFSALILCACGSPQFNNQFAASQGWYEVRQGDTLYSIAWRYDLDYKALAGWNKIEVEATIFPGQHLQLIDPRITAPAVNADTVTETIAEEPQNGEIDTQTSVTSASQARPDGSNPKTWLWPAKGRLLSTFSAKKLNRRGIDIAGKLGQPIQAVADGRVVYSGNGLTGYGNLIIIRHSDIFLSAYAYTRERLVKEGMTVKAGNTIAKMGKHKTTTARLHFQIRKNGKPVDPLQFLPRR